MVCGYVQSVGQCLSRTELYMVNSFRLFQHVERRPVCCVLELCEVCAPKALSSSYFRSLAGAESIARRHHR